MKRIFIVSLLALTVALGAVATGCSGGNNSSSTDKSSSKVESVNDSSADDSSTAEVGDAVDGDFVWDENSCIVNLSKEAAKKSEIVIPKNCIDLMIGQAARITIFQKTITLKVLCLSLKTSKIFLTVCLYMIIT